MKAKSIKGSSIEEISNSLQQIISDEYIPTLAFVFMSFTQDIDGIIEILDKYSIAIYGTTTNGEINDEDILEGAISILLLDIPLSYFKVFFEVLDYKNPGETSKRLCNKALQYFKNPAFFIASSNFFINYSELLRSFSEILGNNVDVYGGVSGDDNLMIDNQLVFTNNNKNKSAVVAVVFDQDKLSIKGKIFCGWNPVGTVKTVTKSKGNKIYEIDGQSAFDITLKYAGIKQLPKDYGELVILVSRTLAMQFFKEEGEPVTLIGMIDKDDGSMTVHQDIREGTKMRFVLPPDFEVVDQIRKSFDELKTAIPHPDAVLVYSCSARIDVLGPIVQDEIKEIYKIWDAPMAGFFCNGELARANKGNLEIHNLTACGVALKEK